MSGHMPVWLWEKLLALPAPSAPYPSLPYRPAYALLKNGKEEPRVIFFGQKTYYSIWGHDKSRRMIDISEVREVQESKEQLPPKFANQLYSTGENRYWGKNFTLVMRDGARFYYTLGGVLDFVSYPSGYTKEDVTQVEDRFWPETKPKTVMPQLSYTWCLYQESREILDRIVNEPLAP
jgi:hypothetical protein